MTIRRTSKLTDQEAPPIDLRHDDNIKVLLENYDKALETRKQAEATIEAAKITLKNRLGNHETAIAADGRTITWCIEHRSEYTVQESDNRVLRIGKPNPGANLEWDMKEFLAWKRKAQT